MTNIDRLIQDALEKHQRGRIGEAYEIYRTLFHKSPSDQLRYLLGVAALQLDRPDEGLSWLSEFKRRADVPPEYALALASAEHQCGQSDEALVRLVELSKQYPKVPAVWNNLGNIHQSQNNWPNAITSYTRALALQPEHHSARFNLALCLQKLGRAQEACQHLKPLIEQGLADENTWGLWVQALRQLHQYSGAQSALDVALRRHPKSAHLWLQQGALFEQQKRWQDALSAYQRAVTLQPELHLAWSQLAYLQATNGEWTALARTLDTLKQLVAEGSTDISPFVLLALTNDPQLQYHAARQWSQRYSPYADTRPTPSHRQRLTIAYLSADFYQHPTAFLAASLFEHHDRQRFRVLAYSNSPDDKSDMRTRLKNAFDAFYDIRHWSVPEIVAHIKSQQVDILIDLKGHTEDALLEVLAQRPAPLQLTYLGYPGTTGAPFIDGVIADSVVLPEQLAQHFSEHPIRLNHCYQVNDVKRPRPQTHMPRSVFGFREDDVVLACFNNSWKISKAMLECWLRILQAVPDTRLWLMDRNPSSRFQSNVRQAVRAHGLDESRVSFALPRPYEEYLRYYLRVDLMLDTFPYNAHTMTSDALWMACPVLTLEGRTFAARVASSLIQTHAPEVSDTLICRNLADYEARAVALAKAPETLIKLRAHLAQRIDTSPLFDSKRFTRDFEEKLRQTWENLICRQTHQAQ